LIGGFLSILFFLPFAVTALTGDISLNRSEMVEYGSMLADFGIINSICSLMSNLFIIAQVCSFINLIPINGKRNVYKAYLMLLSSLSFVVYILAYAGRDGVVYWLMSYVFCFLLFRNFLVMSDLKRLKRFSVLLFAAIMIPFLMITTSRFSEMTGSIAFWLINYAGMQLQNFNNHYQIEVPLLYGKFTFPIIYDFLYLVGFDISSKYDINIFNSYFLSEGVVPWVFATFIGQFIYDYGKIGTLLFLCIMSLATRKLLKKVMRTGTFEFSNLLIFILLYQTVYWGVFYFRLYVSNYYILFIILLCIGFKAVRSSRFSLLYSKAERKLSPNNILHYKIFRLRSKRVSA
jgi:oligosaccharide repeat unit polymerase